MRLTAKLRGKTVTGDAVYDQKGKVYQLLITAQDAKPGSTLKITVTRGAAFQKIGTMKIDELGRGKFSVRNSQGIMPSLLENDQVQLWHGNDSLASGRMTVRK